MSYLPDFLVRYPDGREEWWEVKGYWDSKSRTRINRFRKYYPKETLVIVDGSKYKELSSKYSSIVKNWEVG